MGGDSQVSTLDPGAWKRVMWGWGMYTLTYQVYGTAFPVEAHFYTPIYSSRTLNSGDFFDFAVLGYGDLWFKSGNGGTYAFTPAF